MWAENPLFGWYSMVFTGALSDRWSRCAVCTWVIAGILPVQTPAVTDQRFLTMIDLFSWGNAHRL